MKTKKAISDIVSTVLIIMIAVAAVGIIGAVVVPMVRNSLQGGTACLNALSDVDINAEGTCITKNLCPTGYTYVGSLAVGARCNDTSLPYGVAAKEFANLSVQVRKGVDVTVILGKLSIQVLDSDGNSAPAEINQTDVSLLTNGGYRVFKLTNISNTAKSITLSPVVKMGNSLKQCDASTSQVQLIDCTA